MVKSKLVWLCDFGLYKTQCRKFTAYRGMSEGNRDLDIMGGEVNAHQNMQDPSELLASLNVICQLYHPLRFMIV